MTRPRAGRARGRVRVHWPSVRGRAAAGRGPLLLSAVVIALATLLAAAGPAAMRHTADEAVADAVTRAGPDAGVTAETPYEREDPGRPDPAVPVGRDPRPSRPTWPSSGSARSWTPCWDGRS